MKNIQKILFVLSLVFVIGLATPPSQAASVNNLKEKKTYHYNLDQSGSKEKISYSLSSNKIKVKINGKTIKTITLDSSFYEAHMQIFNCNTKTKGLNIWIYAYADSEDIRYSALYQYKNKKLTRIWNLTTDSDYSTQKMYHRNCGKVVSTNGKGQFTVAMDRALDVDCLTGNHWDKVVYKLSSGKVSKVTGNTYQFYQTYAMVGTSSVKKNGALKTAKAIKFYKNHNKSGGSFTVSKGTKVYPQKAYVSSKTTAYVQFKTSNGKLGWLCTNDYSWTNYPFSNMHFAD
ncbi:MAG: hypothetical protein Q4F79_09060 [Eubacteriales bacterium]|nr:hypothetical protein [Eubacteriales bacterium]